MNPTVPPPTVPGVADLLRNANLNSDSGAATQRNGGDDVIPEALTAGAVDDPVEVIEQPKPLYPTNLAQAQLTGRVELAYIVDTLGVVEPGSISTLMSTHPTFDSTARACVLASRFRAAGLRGRAVRQLVRQTFTFRMGR